MRKKPSSKPLLATRDCVIPQSVKGPEPDGVLPPSFLAAPAEDLSELELLVGGEEAFKEILSALDHARSSIFVQIFIWKDDNIGKRIANKLKAAA